MARNDQHINNGHKDELTDLVWQFIEAKQLKDRYDKIASPLSNQIKKIMGDMDITDVDTPIGRAHVSIRTSESFDEENLIEYLKASGLSRGLVKKKEYIDYDKLESAIYNGKIDAKDLTNFKIVKETKVLSILHGKGGEN